ncbi:MAG: hypothetical protein ACLUE1_03790 [Adlercreutzia equolifaciens]
MNARGYYIVSASPATDLAGRDNFYDTLEAGRIDDGVTVEDIRRNIAAGERSSIARRAPARISSCPSRRSQVPSGRSS